MTSCKFSVARATIVQAASSGRLTPSGAGEKQSKLKYMKLVQQNKML